ncbi:SRPBCC domain-containing protein [Longimicrobium sp.]|uniref:SRPBCC family protein n=1 Tax=Longimicrobium sp. TaxID=2029185 RepID=UPI002E352924|nr:SRPBCC domain-containing protein [Longimicrobium sp.]HEX6038638.1 SRPBCC domain-containing protein [Longimicrobium sp.]
MSTPTPVILRVTRRFSASAERVFDAWLDPEQARRFLFATPMGQMVTVDIDARVGGSFYVVERRDGQDAEHYGEYREIDRPRRLVFSFTTVKGAKDGDRITIDIVPLETGCELTLTHEMSPEWTDWAEQTRQGWTNIVDGLAALVDA